MVEGDEWKRRGRMEEWNSPKNIALDEYTSIIEAHYEHVLRPIVQKGEPLNKDALAMTKSDLEWKLNDPNFKDLPFNIKDAYQNLYNFVKVLDTATDEEIAACKDVLYGLFKLGINCNSLGEEMRGIHVGRNPCRTEQYETQLALKKAEEARHSQLLEAAKLMAQTCIKCPYK